MAYMLHFSADGGFRNPLKCGTEDTQGRLGRHSFRVKEGGNGKQQCRCTSSVNRRHSLAIPVSHGLYPSESVEFTKLNGVCILLIDPTEGSALGTSAAAASNNGFSESIIPSSGRLILGIHDSGQAGQILPLADITRACPRLAHESESHAQPS